MKLNRIANDAYYTNQLLVQQLLNKYPISKDKVILECCNGKGHISNYLKDLGYTLITNDIDINLEADYHIDFTKLHSIDVDYGYKLASTCNTVITNPPFNIATKILENALDVADEVIMLLRLSFIEPCKDRKQLLELYKDNLIKMIVINPRPKFRTDTKYSDTVTVAWFIWNKRFSWNKLGVDCPFDFITDWR